MRLSDWILSKFCLERDLNWCCLQVEASQSALEWISLLELLILIQWLSGGGCPCNKKQECFRPASMTTQGSCYCMLKYKSINYCPAMVDQWSKTPPQIQGAISLLKTQVKFPLGACAQMEKCMQNLATPTIVVLA